MNKVIFSIPNNIYNKLTIDEQMELLNLPIEVQILDTPGEIPMEQVRNDIAFIKKSLVEIPDEEEDIDG